MRPNNWKLVTRTSNDAAAAPSTRQFAREVGVDIGAVPGSGPGGRISVDDVKAHLRANRAGIAQARPQQAPLPNFDKLSST